MRTSAAAEGGFCVVASGSEVVVMGAHTGTRHSHVIFQTPYIPIVAKAAAEADVAKRTMRPVTRVASACVPHVTLSGPDATFGSLAGRGIPRTPLLVVAEMGEPTDSTEADAEGLHYYFATLLVAETGEVLGAVRLEAPQGAAGAAVQSACIVLPTGAGAEPTTTTVNRPVVGIVSIGASLHVVHFHRTMGSFARCVDDDDAAAQVAVAAAVHDGAAVLSAVRSSGKGELRTVAVAGLTRAVLDLSAAPAREVDAKAEADADAASGAADAGAPTGRAGFESLFASIVDSRVVSGTVKLAVARPDTAVLAPVAGSSVFALAHLPAAATGAVKKDVEIARVALLSVTDGQFSLESDISVTHNQPLAPLSVTVAGVATNAVGATVAVVAAETLVCASVTTSLGAAATVRATAHAAPDATTATLLVLARSQPHVVAEAARRTGANTASGGRQLEGATVDLDTDGALMCTMITTQVVRGALVRALVAPAVEVVSQRPGLVNGMRQLTWATAEGALGGDDAAAAAPAVVDVSSALAAWAFSLDNAVEVTRPDAQAAPVVVSGRKRPTDYRRAAAKSIRLTGAVAARHILIAAVESDVRRGYELEAANWLSRTARAHALSVAVDEVPALLVGGGARPARWAEGLLRLTLRSIGAEKAALLVAATSAAVRRVASRQFQLDHSATAPAVHSIPSVLAAALAVFEAAVTLQGPMGFTLAARTRDEIEQTLDSLDSGALQMCATAGQRLRAVAAVAGTAAGRHIDGDDDVLSGGNGAARLQFVLSGLTKEVPEALHGIDLFA